MPAPNFHAPGAPPSPHGPNARMLPGTRGGADGSLGELRGTTAPWGCSMTGRLPQRHLKLGREDGPGGSAHRGSWLPGRVRLYALFALLLVAAGVLLMLRLRGRPAQPPDSATPPIATEPPPPDAALAAHIRQLESAVLSAPTDVDARVRLAEAYLDARRPADALGALEPIPDRDGTIHLLLGRACADVGRFEAAEEHLRAAHAAMPDDAEAPSRLGLLLAEAGQLEEGAALCREVVAEHPDDYDAMLRLVRARLLSQDMGRKGQQEARQTLARAIELRPDEAEAYALMARTQLLYPDEAVRYATKAIELDPRSAEAYQVLGWVYYLRDPTEENVRLAEENYVKALALDPNNPTVRFQLGILYGRAGRNEESVRELEEALVLAPSAWEIWHALAAAYKRAGRDQDAAEVRRHVRMESEYREQERKRRRDARLAPEDPQAYVRLAEFYLKYEKTRLAAKAAGIALELDPDNQEAARLLRASGGVAP